MSTCDTCGNKYDKPLKIDYRGKTGNFDSFECAIQKFAPECDTCGCRIIGHGMESEGVFYCCAHCARKDGVRGVDDRAD